jgi:transposase InsO family protein
MPWKEVIPMKERARFVLMVEEEVKSFAEVCGEFEISRKTGYKWWKRYEEDGLYALEERSRRPLRSPQSTPYSWRRRILILKKRWPHWGAKKLRARLLKRTKNKAVPATSTIQGILEKVGLVKRGRKRRLAGPVVAGGGLTEASGVNEVWAVDYKGWFRLGNGHRCEPLTVSDLYTRYILCCTALPDVSFAQARPVFEELFKEKGQPVAIRVDNGPPFGSRGAAGLGRLAVWWVSLGIKPEFIEPGCPEQNPSHERMHRTLKAEATKPVSWHSRAQQKRLDKWRFEFNQERPHEALGQVTPGSIYRKSSVRYGGVLKPEYTEGMEQRRVRGNGEIQWGGRKRFVGEAFIGQSVGVLKAVSGKHQVFFYNYLLGEIEDGDLGGMRPTVMVRVNHRREKK